MAIETPHLAFPLRFDSATHSLAQVEQDELEDIEQCVFVLMKTPLGVRPLAPDIGVEDPTFSEGIDPQLLTADLENMEPRARVTITAEPVGATGEQVVTISVQRRDSNDDPFADEEVA